MVTRKRTYLLATVSALSLLVVLCLVTLAASSGGSAGGTLRSGRTVMTYSDSIYLSSSFSADTATITSGRQTIIVKPDSLIVNDVPVASIDPGVADVRVTVANGEVAFVADGRPVSLTR